jgi:hypothetical protein
MSTDMLEIQIAMTGVHGIPADKPLPERLAYAMRYVREHEDDLFFMSHAVNDDLMMRTALAAVMVAGDEADKDIIARSLQPLKMLSAAMQGIPVDFSAMGMSDDLVPLMKIWNESKP